MTRHRIRKPLGFTLIELMVTISIGIMLAVVAIPSFIDFRRNSELSDAVTNLTLAAGSARSAALKTGRNVFVQAATGTDWRSGWFVFVDSNWNNAFDESSDEVVMRQAAVTSQIAVAASTASFADGYLMFSGAGFPRTKAGVAANGTLTFANASRSTNVIVDTSGRLRSCKVGTAGCAAI